MSGAADVRADARSSILERIRRVRGLGSEGAGAELASSISEEWDRLPRDYQVRGRLDLRARLDLLESRLRDYDAAVTRVGHVEVARAVGAVLRARGSRATIVPPGFPEAWRPVGVSLTEDDGLSARALDGFDGVLVTVSVAIAETGTLVLRHGAGEGRRALTLVPDFAMCIVRAEDVVETVPEAFARLEGQGTGPITFVSGPSATADIEMTRIKGVHGPRFLHVFMVTDDAAPDLR